MARPAGPAGGWVAWRGAWPTGKSAPSTGRRCEKPDFMRPIFNLPFPTSFTVGETSAAIQVWRVLAASDWVCLSFCCNLMRRNISGLMQIKPVFEWAGYVGLVQQVAGLGASEGEGADRKFVYRRTWRRLQARRLGPIRGFSWVASWLGPARARAPRTAGRGARNA